MEPTRPSMLLPINDADVDTRPNRGASVFVHMSMASRTHLSRSQPPTVVNNQGQGKKHGRHHTQMQPDGTTMRHNTHTPTNAAQSRTKRPTHLRRRCVTAPKCTTRRSTAAIPPTRWCRPRQRTPRPRHAGRLGGGSSAGGLVGAATPPSDSHRHCCCHHPLQRHHSLARLRRLDWQPRSCARGHGPGCPVQQHWWAALHTRTNTNTGIRTGRAPVRGDHSIPGQHYKHDTGNYMTIQ